MRDIFESPSLGWRSRENSLAELIKNGKIDSILKQVKDGELNPECVVAEGLTLIEFAALYGQQKLVEFLLATGANPRDALLIAIKKGYQDIIAALEGFGITINKQDFNGQTALHRAAQAGRIADTKILLENRANLTIKDYYGNTPVQIAAKYNQLNITALLLRYEIPEYASCIANAHVRRWAPFPILHLAVIYGDVTIIRLIFSKYKDSIQEQDLYGNTALHAAAQTGRIEAIKFLLDNGVNIDAIGSKRQTALHTAAENGQVEVIKFLIQNKANIDAANVSRNTALHAAAENGQVEAIKCLLDNGVNIDAVSRASQTALHRAVVNGQAEVVKFLIRNHANIDAEAENRQTALHLAVSKGDRAMTELLLTCGARIDIQDEYGLTALHVAARHGHANIIALILQNETNVNIVDTLGTTALSYAAKWADEATIELLLACGAEIDQTGRDLFNALKKVTSDRISEFEHNPKRNIANFYLLCSKGFGFGDKASDMLIEVAKYDDEDIEVSAVNKQQNIIGIMKLLLENNAKVNATSRSKYREAALHRAAINGHIRVIEFLLNKADININIEDANGDTPLHLAAKKNQVVAVDILLNHGANVDAINKCKYTALQTAIVNGLVDDDEDEEEEEVELPYGQEPCSTRILRLLLNHGADVNKKTDLGSTALHFAAFRRHSVAIQLLLEHNARVNDQVHGDFFGGYTALHHAVSRKRQDIVILLLNSGKVNPSIQANHDTTALDIAREVGEPDIAELITSYQHNPLLFLINNEAERHVILEMAKSSQITQAQQIEAIIHAVAEGEFNILAKVIKVNPDKSYLQDPAVMTAFHNKFKKDEPGSLSTQDIRDRLTVIDFSLQQLINSSSAVQREMVRQLTKYHKTFKAWVVYRQREEETTKEVILNLDTTVDYAQLTKHLAVQSTRGELSQYQKDTCLIAAAKNGNYQLVKALLAEGADANAVDQAGESVLAYACARMMGTMGIMPHQDETGIVPFKNIVNILLQQQASISQLHNGTSILYSVFVEDNTYLIVRLLLADINALYYKDDAGNTLFTAMDKNKPKHKDEDSKEKSGKDEKEKSEPEVLYLEDEDEQAPQKPAELQYTHLLDLIGAILNYCTPGELSKISQEDRDKELAKIWQKNGDKFARIQDQILEAVRDAGSEYENAYRQLQALTGIGRFREQTVEGMQAVAMRLDEDGGAPAVAAQPYKSSTPANVGALGVSVAAAAQAPQADGLMRLEAGGMTSAPVFAAQPYKPGTPANVGALGASVAAAAQAPQAAGASVSEVSAALAAQPSALAVAGGGLKRKFTDMLKQPTQATAKQMRGRGDERLASDDGSRSPSTPGLGL